MNFSISKKVLFSYLTIVNRAISNIAPVPALSGVKIDVLIDRIILTGSDSTISIRSTIIKNEENNLLIEEEGSLLIDARYLNEIVRKMDAEIITFSTVDGTLTRIKGEHVKFDINGMRPSDYPDIEFNVTTIPFKMNTKTFSDIVRQTAFACSDKETRPALTGVNFAANNNVLTCNATDSYRLATKKVNLIEDLNFNFTLSSKVLNEIVNIVANELDFEIAIDDTKMFVINKETIIRTRLIEDAYPDTSRLIPTSFAQVLEVDAKRMIDAVDRTSFIKSDGKNVIRLAIDNEKVELSSSNQDVVSSNDTIDVINFDGNPINIACSGKYLIDAIKAINKDVITLSFSGELRPIIIKAKDSEELIQLISPVRTY